MFVCMRVCICRTYMHLCMYSREMGNELGNMESDLRSPHMGMIHRARGSLCSIWGDGANCKAVKGTST